MAGRDSGERLERMQKSAKVEALEVGRKRRIDARRVAADRGAEGHTQRATQRIEDRAIDERRAVVAARALSPMALARSEQRAVVRRGVAERRAR